MRLLWCLVVDATHGYYDGEVVSAVGVVAVVVAVFVRTDVVVVVCCAVVASVLCVYGV